MTCLRPTRSDTAPMIGITTVIATRLIAVTSSAVPMENPLASLLRKVGM